MPLQDGDIEVIAINTRTIKMPSGKMGDVKEIRFRVRGMDEQFLYIPLEEYNKAYAEQMIIRAAAEDIDLLDRFPVRG